MEGFNGVVLLLVLQRIFEAFVLLNALRILILNLLCIILSFPLILVLQTRQDSILEGIVGRLVVDWNVFNITRFKMMAVMAFVTPLGVIGDARVVF